MDDILPYGRQAIDGDDVAAVTRVLESALLTTGPTVAAFEETFAKEVGVRFAVACSSATAGLHLAAMALDLGPGDSAVVPTLTFLATANVARLVDAEVAFADVDPDTGLMTPPAAATAAAAATKPRAVFNVHLNGQVGDVRGLAIWARGQGLAVVEDACHALGTRYGNGHAVGACDHCDMAVFSFHPVKIVAAGEGGMVTTNDAELCRRLRAFRNHGMVRDATAFTENDQARDSGGEANPWYYEMPQPGLNYRLSDIHCALGLSQLGKLADFAARRRALAARYDQLLAPLAPTVRPIARTPGCAPAWHLYVVLIDFDALSVDRAAVMRRLAATGVGTQVHYVPVHWQPYYRRRYGHRTLSGADRYYRRCLSLPLFPAMADTDVDRVVTALAEAIA